MPKLAAEFQRSTLLGGMTRNWTPHDTLPEVLMGHLYIWAPRETEVWRIIETMADGMPQDMDKVGYGFVVTGPGVSGSSTRSTYTNSR